MYLRKEKSKGNKFTNYISLTKSLHKNSYKIIRSPKAVNILDLQNYKGEQIVNSVMQKAVNPERYRIGNQDGPRPNFPYKDPVNALAYPNPILGVGATTKHHAIPWNKLKSFVHALITNGHPEINTIAQIAANVMISQSPLIDETRMQGNTTIASITNEINAPAVNGYQAEDQESIAAAICWYPGNLFIGPDTNSRADDPGENFESKAYVALGNRFDVLDRLNTNIDAFILNPVQPLNPVIIEDLNTIMGWNTPKAYNPIAWNKVYGKYYLID